MRFTPGQGCDRIGLVLGVRRYGDGGVPTRGRYLVEVGHQHTWWHYYVIRYQDRAGGVWEDRTIEVWDNPFEPAPDYIDDGYACFCGATPPGVAP